MDNKAWEEILAFDSKEEVNGTIEYDATGKPYVQMKLNFDCEDKRSN